MAETEKNPRRSTRKLRCVIYTRKSTDEGLDQAFNSLDAQREACAAFIQSQKHEGWAVSPTLYDDGGFSGGSLERPALKRLLADIEAGLVDVIVVYKVDRLTRALSDFAKLVEIFDRRLLKARILLKADVSEADEGWSDSWIIQAVDTRTGSATSAASSAAVGRHEELPP